MDEILDFIEARLEEDEAIARVATPGPWRHSPDKHWRKPGTSWFEEAVFTGAIGSEAVCIAGTGETDEPQSMSDAAHIARHDPARVLREVAALRKIMDVLSLRVDIDGQGTVGYTYGGIKAIKAVASIWSDHDDYREEWAS